MKKIKIIMIVCMMGIMAIVFSACPTPEENNKTKKDEPLTVTQLIQASLWENDAKSDCDTGPDVNRGNDEKYIYLFDTEGKYYSSNFQSLNLEYGSDTSCGATSGWPTKITRAQYLKKGGENVLAGTTQTYRVSGNTITLITDYTAGFDDDISTMTYDASGGGSIKRNNADGTVTVYTILDKSWDGE